MYESTTGLAVTWQVTRRCILQTLDDSSFAGSIVPNDKGKWREKLDRRARTIVERPNAVLSVNETF